MAREGGPATDFGRGWFAKAALIRGRDRFTCRRCGRKWTLVDGPLWPVDHIIPRRLYATLEEANRNANLVLLCPGCHGWKTARAERLALRGDRHDMTGYLRALGLRSVAGSQ